MQYIFRDTAIRVTPHTGVWIETSIASIVSSESRVTPHTGVWIETDFRNYAELKPTVTPHTGVWIETEDVHKSIRGN